MSSISLAEYKKLYGNKPNSKRPKRGAKKQSKGEGNTRDAIKSAENRI